MSRVGGCGAICTPRFLWLWGCLSIALALPLAEVASQALTESAFILFVTLSLTQIDAHLRGGGRAALIRAAAFSALACLTRYMGVSVILAVVAMLLAARVAPREKVKRIAVYTLIAASPVGLWMLRNFLLTETATGSRGRAFYSFHYIANEALQIAVMDWWLVGLTAPVLLALVMAACHALHRRLHGKRDAPVGSDVAWGALLVFGGFALAYLTVLVAAMMSGGVWLGLEWRYLNPVYIPLLVAALLLMDGALRYARKRAPRGIVPRRRGVQAIGGGEILAAVVMLALSLQAAWLAALHGREIPHWDAGVRQSDAAPRWVHSESLQYIRDAALTGTLLSIDYTPLHLWLADSPVRPVRLGCEETDRLRTALVRALGSGEEVHVLNFGDPWKHCTRQQSDDLRSALSREPWLELVAELADGKLYRLRERELRPAMFYSSYAPVEGKSFGAFLDKSRGRRLPGEPWRWEKGSDADGWTSLPVQRDSGRYTPTVADVGHHLRASVYYADGLGNRVKAITEPSAPVRAVPARLLVADEGTGAMDATGVERIIRSQWDVYLRGNRLIYGNRSCRWEDAYKTRFPLSVYSLDSESGTPALDTLGFEWNYTSLQNGTCVIERQLPDKDIFAIRTGQVDRDGNLLWEAEYWFEENRRLFGGYGSSLTTGEPVARDVFDIYLNGGSLVAVKDPCGREDTEPGFSVLLHLTPADVEDLPHSRQRYGYDSLHIPFQWHGLRSGGKCMVIHALPEYDITQIRVAQVEGDSVLWGKTFSVVRLLVADEGTGAMDATGVERIIRSQWDVYLRGNRLIYGNRSCRWEDAHKTRFPLSVYSLDSESGTPALDTLGFEWTLASLQNGTCVIERQLPDKDIFAIQTGQVDRDGNLLWEAEYWFEENRRLFDGYGSSPTSGEPVARDVFDIYLGGGSLVAVKDPCGREDISVQLHLTPADVEDLPHSRQRHGYDSLHIPFQWHGLRSGGKCMVIRALPEYDITQIRVARVEGDSVLWGETFSVP